jgi:hypothetical protein
VKKIILVHLSAFTISSSHKAYISSLRMDQLIMGYFDNLDNGSLKKYKKIKIEKNL